MRCSSCTDFPRIAEFFSHLGSNIRDSLSKIIQKIFKAKVFRRKKSDHDNVTKRKVENLSNGDSHSTSKVVSATSDVINGSTLSEAENMVYRTIAISEFVVQPEILREEWKNLDLYFKFSFANTPIDQLIQDLSRNKHEIEWLSIGSCYLNWIQYQIAACENKNLEKLLRTLADLMRFFKQQNNEYLFVFSIGPLSSIAEVRRLVFKYNIMNLDEAKELQMNGARLNSPDEIKKSSNNSRLPNLAFYNLKLDEINKQKYELNRWLQSKNATKNPETLKEEIAQREKDILAIREKLSHIQNALSIELKNQTDVSKNESLLQSLFAFRKAVSNIDPVKRNNILRAEIKKKLSPLLVDN